MINTIVFVFSFAVFVVTHANSFHLNPGNRMLEREHVAIKKGLALALLGKMKENTGPFYPNESEYGKTKTTPHFHPMVRLRADTMSFPPYDAGSLDGPYEELFKHLPRDVRDDHKTSMDASRMADQGDDSTLNDDCLPRE